jgi:kynureninase
MAISDRGAHPSLLSARELDARDPAPARDAFELPIAGGKPLVYLAGHSLGPMPRAARELVEHELDAWSALGVAGWWREQEPWLTAVEELAAGTARVVGAQPTEVVTMNALTVNLHLLWASFYRPTRERYAIVMEESAFPSDRYAVGGQLRTRGLDPNAALIRVGPRPGEDLLRTEEIEAALDRDGARIALVWLPGVQYRTGQRLDIERITAAAHRAGALAGWDLAHAAGNVRLQLHEWDVDFAVWCSYKYLNSGPGGPGQAFVHERLAADTSVPRLGGWWGNDPDTRMEMRDAFEPRPSAAGWLVSTPPILALAPLRASLELFEKHGMEALATRSTRLTAYLEWLLDRRGIGPVITPRDADERGAMLTLRTKTDAHEVETALAARGAVVDARGNDLLRIAPAPLYTSYADLEAFVDLLAEVVGATASASRRSASPR